MFTDADRLVTPDRIPDLLKAIELEHILKVEECQALLDYYEGKTAPFDMFYKDLIRLMDSIAD